MISSHPDIMERACDACRRAVTVRVFSFGPVARPVSVRLCRSCAAIATENHIGAWGAGAAPLPSAEGMANLQAAPPPEPAKVLATMPSLPCDCGTKRIDDDTAFIQPFGTVRACLGCNALVAGGPTRCVRCAEAGR